MERIHDHEVDTAEPVLRSLLADQCPQWVDAPAARIDSTGTSNTLWRLHTSPNQRDVVVRLPRQPNAESGITTEVQLLPVLARSPLAATVTLPAIVHIGEPTPSFSMQWIVAEWIDGTDLWAGRERAAADPHLATTIAEVVGLIRSLDTMPVETRRVGQRGGPIDAVIEQVRGWLSNPAWGAHLLLDVPAVHRLLDEAEETNLEPVEISFTHGDLIPGNLLTDTAGRLDAVIDWGGAGVGDRAQDLAPAWSIFDRPARTVFRDALGVGEAEWLRARTIELEHAVGGVLYYRPRGHALADVMAATLDRILTNR